jgi:hypothetical protein
MAVAGYLYLLQTLLYLSISSQFRIQLIRDSWQVLLSKESVRSSLTPTNAIEQAAKKIDQEIARKSRRQAEPQGGTTIRVDFVIPTINLAVPRSPENLRRSESLPILNDAARSRQVYIGWLWKHCLLLSAYLRDIGNMTIGSSCLSCHSASPIQLNLSRRRRYQCTKASTKIQPARNKRDAGIA